MEAIIRDTLNEAQTKELFEREAVFMFSHDVIPMYRTIELFGEYLAKWYDECIKYEGYLEGGKDWNAVGDVTNTPIIDYFYYAGFKKIVSKHNENIMRERHFASEAGQLIEEVWAERCRRIEEADAENERKRQERKAKRAAAKAAREAAKKEQEGE